MRYQVQFKDYPDQNYYIHIGRNLLPETIKEIKEKMKLKRLAIITDGNVIEAGHLDKLDPKHECPFYAVMPDSTGNIESKKNIATYGEIVDFLDQHKFEKNDALICLGGGVIGDIGGFVAGTYKRGGMNYVQIPTTTISQADSSIGGKCAIDSRVSKNAAGCFYQPSVVITDIDTLDTLDDRNYRSGLVESVKHGVILDKAYFNMFEEKIEDILKKDKDVLERIAYNNADCKGSVVGIDPHEKNYRRSLNFGHTIGHAIETASDYRLYHGESVALGIMAALYISYMKGMKENEIFRVQKLLSKLGMPKKVPDYVSRQTVENLLANDKKAKGGVPYFVTVDEIGKLHTENNEYAAPIDKIILKGAMELIF